MFAAWEAYRPHHDRLMGRLRVAVGPAKGVSVEVQRQCSDLGVLDYRTLARVWPPGDDEPQLFVLSDPAGWFEDW